MARAEERKLLLQRLKALPRRRRRSASARAVVVRLAGQERRQGPGCGGAAVGAGGRGRRGAAHLGAVAKGLVHGSCNPAARVRSAFERPHFHRVVHAAARKHVAQQVHVDT